MTVRTLVPHHGAAPQWVSRGALAWEWHHFVPQAAVALLSPGLPLESLPSTFTSSGTPAVGSILQLGLSRAAC